MTHTFFSFFFFFSEAVSRPICCVCIIILKQVWIGQRNYSPSLPWCSHETHSEPKMRWHKTFLCRCIIHKRCFLWAEHATHKGWPWMCQPCGKRTGSNPPTVQILIAPSANPVLPSVLPMWTNSMDNQHAQAYCSRLLSLHLCMYAESPIGRCGMRKCCSDDNVPRQVPVWILVFPDLLAYLQMVTGDVGPAPPCQCNYSALMHD